MNPFTLLGATVVLAAIVPFVQPASEACTANSACAMTSMGDRAAKDIVDTAVGAGSFNTLAAALKAGGLVDTLKGKGPFTVFAPTDEAFAKLPKGTLESLLDPKNKATLVNILTYHVVPGSVMAEQVVKLPNAAAVNGQRLAIHVADGVVTIAGVKVTKTDIACSNGVIHVIDTVLMPATKNIVETAVNAGTFNTLVAAAKAAGLAETLSTGGPFTVFAPRDEAFAKLPKGTVEDLLKPENKDKLASILKYHVVSGRVYADQVVKLTEANTLLGKTVAVKVDHSKVMIGNANVVKTDIETTNGVVHVIDTVLIPQ